jgi:hypothetical protein
MISGSEKKEKKREKASSPGKVDEAAKEKKKKRKCVDVLCCPAPSLMWPHRSAVE